MLPLLLGILGALVASACGGSSAESEWPDVLTLGEEEPYARVVSNELIVGENRFVFGLLDEDNAPIIDAEVSVVFFNLDRSKTEPVDETPARQIHTSGTVPESGALTGLRHAPPCP
ncbi:MAG TPA: hypothetical protein VMR52_04400 [Dehalococcoidia bacterium]|nr:hypothetical protein [Dehalococcoidia bacterium]